MHYFSRSFFTALRRSVAAALMIGLGLLTFQIYALAQGEGEPEDPVTVFNQAQDLHEKGDLAGAIRLYDKALKIAPEFPEAEYQRGIAELALGNNSEAEKSFRHSIELRADWTLAMASLGSLLIEKNELLEAERLLTRVIELEPQNPPALVAMTDLRLSTNASPTVLQDLLAKITALTGKQNPTASLWTARAALETALGKRDLAKASLANAVAIDPKNKAALFQLANIAIAGGDIIRAKEIAARLEIISPSSDHLRLLKANIAANEGNLDDALKQLDAIDHPGPAATDLRNRINTSRTTSPADLEKQLATNAKDPVILGRLCNMYRRDDPAKALDYCRRAAEAEPNNMDHAVGYGAALVQAKQFEGAVNLFRKILEMAPDNSTAHANLATALFQLKRYPEAKVEFQWLTNAQPKAAAAYYFLAIVHDQMDEYLDALANYQQYLRLADPVANQLEIDKVNLRLPILQREIKAGKGKKNSE